MKWLIKGGIVAVIVFLPFLSAALYSLSRFDGNYSGFLHLKERFFDRNAFGKDMPELKEDFRLSSRGGHDQTFFFAMAFDPFLLKFKHNPHDYRRVVDNPPVRYSRIGYPLLINLFSLNQPQLFPKVMFFLILASLLIGPFCLVQIMMIRDTEIAAAAFYLLVSGFWLSLWRVLPEPLCAAFLLAGILFHLKRKLPISICFFSLAVLIRETALIFVVILAANEYFKERDRKSAFIILFSLIPFIAWKTYLTYRLFPAYGWGTIMAQKLLTYPFGGILQLFHNIRSGDYSSNKTPAAIFLAIFLILIFIFACILAIRRKRIEDFALLAYSLLSISINFDKVWVGIGNIERTTYEVFLFLILSYSITPKQARPIRIIFYCFFLLELSYNIFLFSENRFFLNGILFRGFIGNSFG